MFFTRFSPAGVKPVGLAPAKYFSPELAATRSGCIFAPHLSFYSGGRSTYILLSQPIFFQFLSIRFNPRPQFSALLHIVVRV
jgi:hypothetical protein